MLHGQLGFPNAELRWSSRGLCMLKRYLPVKLSLNLIYNASPNDAPRMFKSKQLGHETHSNGFTVNYFMFEMNDKATLFE